MNEHLKQTGRTERLIQEAIRLATLGRAVYILAHTSGYARQLAQRVDATVGHRNHGIKVETASEDFDWQLMRPLSAYPGCLWLVDHALAEIQLEKLDQKILRLQQLQRQIYQLTM